MRQSMEHGSLVQAYLTVKDLEADGDGIPCVAAEKRVETKTQVRVQG